MHLGGNRLWVPLFDESENVLKEQAQIDPRHEKMQISFYINQFHL